MSITTETDNDRQLTIHTGIGNVTFEEFMELMKQFYADPQTMNVLWDVRKAIIDISFKETEVLVNYITPYSNKRASGKSAVVISRELEYGMSRVVKNLLEINKIPFRFKIFRSYEEAMHWLDEE